MSEKTELLASDFHRQMLTQLMMKSMTATNLEDEYAELLSLAYAMVGELGYSEGRVRELEQRLKEKP